MLLVLSRRGREEPQCGFEIASDYYFGSTAQAQRGRKFREKMKHLGWRAARMTRRAGRRERARGTKEKTAQHRVTVSQSDNG